MMNKKFKRIFDFICFFIIVPIVVTTSGFIITQNLGLGFSKLELLLITLGIWIWLVLSYRFLNKIFD